MIVVNKNTGLIVKELHCPVEMIELNIAEDELALASEGVSEETHYYDFELQCFQKLPPKPSMYHVVDHLTKNWIDTRSIDQVKGQRWEEIKREREATEFGGFLFLDCIFDSDIQSQSRILAVSNINHDLEWTTQKNGVVYLTSQQLKGLSDAMMKHISKCHERGRIARQKINEAKSVKEVEAVIF